MDFIFPKSPYNGYIHETPSKLSGPHCKSNPTFTQIPTCVKTIWQTHGSHGRGAYKMVQIKIIL